MIETIQKRTTIFCSAQPSFSKWWWIGAIRKTRLPGQLERGHLDDDREGLDHEDAAHHRQQDLLADQHGDGPERAAQGERADVAHEEVRRAMR